MKRVLVVGLSLGLLSCGGGKNPEYRPVPPVGGTQTPGNGGSDAGGISGGSVNEAQALGYFSEQCAECHPANVGSGAALKRFGALARMNDGSMPLRSGRNYAIFNDQKKNIMLAYLRSL